MTKKVFIVYHPDYNIDKELFSKDFPFDTYKPLKIIENLKRLNLLNEEIVITPEPIKPELLKLVHTSDYIEKINDKEKIFKIAGIENFIRDNKKVDFLKYLLLVTGGSVTAALKAYEEKALVFNLAGGFHHASSNNGGGFCVINDVAVAVKYLRNKLNLKKILIVDLDYHQGDGTALIFEKDESVFTFSAHSNNWVNINKFNNLDIEFGYNVNNKQYLKVIKIRLKEVFKTFKPEIVFYLAGADPYEKDTLFGMGLSKKDMLERDKIVLSLSKKYNLPMVVFPAGGYGPDSWQVYFEFIKFTLTKIKP